jgi:hypothetical protein
MGTKRKMARNKDTKGHGRKTQKRTSEINETGVR